MHYRLTLCLCLLLALTSLHSHAEGIEVVTEDSLYAYLRDGKLVGPGTRVVEQTLDKAGLTDHHILLYPWARAYDKALHEPNVLIYPMDRTVLREPLFKWVGELERVTIKLYKLRERHDITLSNLEDAKLYTVGVVRNDSKQLLMQQQGFTRLVVSADRRDNFQKLLHRQVQLLPMPENAARIICDEEHVAFADLEEVYSFDERPARVFMAFSLSTPDEIVARAQRAFEQLEASGEVVRIMREER